MYVSTSATIRVLCLPSPAMHLHPMHRHSDRGGSLDQEETFLDRIEQLAYADKRRMEASRSALAEHVHATECTFAPAINPRSARMARVSDAGQQGLSLGGGSGGWWSVLGRAWFAASGVACGVCDPSRRGVA